MGYSVKYPYKIITLTGKIAFLEQEVFDKNFEIEKLGFRIEALETKWRALFEENKLLKRQLEIK